MYHNIFIFPAEQFFPGNFVDNTVINAIIALFPVQQVAQCCFGNKLYTFFLQGKNRRPVWRFFSFLCLFCMKNEKRKMPASFHQNVARRETTACFTGAIIAMQASKDGRTKNADPAVRLHASIVSSLFTRIMNQFLCKRFWCEQRRILQCLIY